MTPKPAIATTATSTGPASERSTGLLQGLGAYGLWGMMPLYFLTIAIASPWEIVASRIVFSLVFCMILLSVSKSWTVFLALSRDRRAMIRLSIASVLIAVNWLTYTYAVLNGHATEAALGYFINPLVSIGLGVIFLKEKLRTMQWVAIGFGLAAVITLTFAYGNVPYIALTLAFSFGLYGFVKNRVGRTATALTSLTMETIILLVPALGFMIWLVLTNADTLVSAGPAHFWLLAASGIVTAVPLLLFGAAARRLPLSTLGTMQFLVPILQFIVAMVVFKEPMPPERLIGFSLIWVAVILLCIDMAREPRRLGSTKVS
ncbi:EamA family transporter RarD [Paeniglutamicibacter gangotriensis]|uniref:Chloramphenicol sensitive protein n=2 Tax=Paeniglutamicibacter gangotriensis TaxID=254787 RepID=M7MVE2_9MICC|nr:EamA family transporter RarD [Paeniglutamicibacter gangotriensis]EMQ99006.1 chloramphenicol sensitive protein [Paeniglutamicibacter gangotriensis Lz1y]KAA0974342.1 EamA family transporter RarD [Paeniglutamicibacter gangotriensis]